MTAPISTQRPSAIPSLLEDETDGGRLPLRVLVIEVSRPVAEITRLLLLEQGHEAAVAHDGPAGLELARQFRPQAVLCAINLSGAMDGYSVARAFRAHPELSRSLLVAATAHACEDVAGNAAHAGFDHVLTKPIDFQKLQPILERSGAMSPN